jgi:hypothetical protein
MTYQIVDMNDMSGLVDNYFEYCFDGNMLMLDEETVEQSFDNYINEFFGEGGDGVPFAEWCEMNIDPDKLPPEILIGMLNYMFKEDYTNEDTGMIKPVRDIMNAFAWRVIICNREEYLEEYEGFIKFWDKCVEDEREDDENELMSKEDKKV